jgi:hypothetical protein
MLVLSSIKGVTLYMAPELVLERRYDSQGDVLSLRALLFGFARLRQKLQKCRVRG